MKDLKYFKEKIKNKKKQNSFKDFLMSITCRAPINLHRQNSIMSRYPGSDRIKGVLSIEDFNKTRDNLTKSGLDYDFTKGFFDNLSLLMKNTYFPSRITFYENENSDYSDIVLGSKNIYLSYVTINNCENVLYSISTKDNCSDIYNSGVVFDNSSNCYFTFGVINSYNIFYSRYIINSNNIWFSSNLTGCGDCIFCDNLENESYCIKNKRYSKENYLKEKEKILMQKELFIDWYKSLDKVGKNYGTNNSSGNFLTDCEDVENGFNCYGIKSGRNIVLVGSEVGNENMFDVYQAGSPSGDDMYGVVGAGGGVQNLFNSCNVNGGSNVFYSLFLEDCSYCVGCIGLKNKSYCILNKQYSKEEWEITAIKIFSQMEEDGILGDFFPGDLNPFYFNDTMGYVLGNFSKEEIIDKGYMWREGEIKVDIPEGAEVVYTGSSVIANKVKQSSSLYNYESNHYRDDKKYLNDFQGYIDSGSSQEGQKWYINPEILKKVIKDEKGNYYRIVKMEYDFLMKHGLPLPEIHRLDRIKLGFKFK